MSRRSKLSKEDLERDNARLRRRIEEMKTEHAIQIGAKTRTVEAARTGDLLFELGQSYPHLSDLNTLGIQEKVD
jgi:hypothetical protein